MPRQETAARRAYLSDVSAFHSAGAARHEEIAPLAAAAHDFRDPLQAIASYAELLADGAYGAVNAEQHMRLMRLRGHVDHLSAIVGSILVLARARQHGRLLELTDVPLRPLLADVHALIECFAAARGVSFVVDCDGAPATVRGERTALRRVLANLAGNAVKFTPRGGCVSLLTRASAVAVELHVADTGPGIPPEQLGAIFAPFVQLDPAQGPDEAGAGLGLAIARDLTSLMGGELFARSIVGVGSVFVARFPR